MSIWSAAYKDYALDATRLFILQGWSSPEVLSDKNSQNIIISCNMEHDEDIFKQSMPLNSDILTVDICMTNKVELEMALLMQWLLSLWH